MGALQKVKAYFGMIPVDELDDYDYYDDAERDRFDADREPAYSGAYRQSEYERRRPAPRAERPERTDRADYGSADDRYSTRIDRSAQRDRPWHSQPPTRGALAMEPEPEPVAVVAPVPSPAPRRQENPLSRIITLHPTSYYEARTIGEHYRDGAPVIINLTEMADADAKRLVDFAAGLVFALHGTMDKVTSKVFLLSPPDVDVTAEDRKRIAEGGYIHRR